MSKDIEQSIVSILKEIESRRRDELKTRISDPAQVESLSLSELHEIADIGLQEAHRWIIENSPQITDVLLSLECLICFIFREGEPSTNDKADVVSSLEEIWKAAGGKHDSDLLADSRVGLFASSHL